MHVPTFDPRAMAIPASRVMIFWPAKIINKPVVAAELWTRAVKSAPTMMPSKAWSIWLMSSMKGWYCLSGDVLELIIAMPKKTSPKPSRICP